jgi:hypothetical protein
MNSDTIESEEVTTRLNRFVSEQPLLGSIRFRFKYSPGANPVPLFREFAFGGMRDWCLKYTPAGLSD